MADQATESAQTPESFNRFAIPVRWGIILGILICILFTIRHMFLVDDVITYYIVTFLTQIVILVFYCIAGVQQRKAMGGYISFKEAFSAIFVVILISLTIDAIYTSVYIHLIDPDILDKLREMMITGMEKFNTPEEKIEQAIVQFDEGKADSGKVWPIVFMNLKYLIAYSIFGFICAAIVKKNKPVFGT